MAKMMYGGGMKAKMGGTSKRLAPFMRGMTTYGRPMMSGGLSGGRRMSGGAGGGQNRGAKMGMARRGMRR